ncbi:MAG: glycerol-3-phosphate acyltransferase [Desulfuromonadales bacterium]|jgi:acyl phosphate:glycerol-3-phosphate acyltransferase
MITIFPEILFVLSGYALGCLVTGYYLVRRQRGIDVRNCGSGSAGATNVGRLLGRSGFVKTLAGDFGKGGLAVSVASALGCQEPWLALVLIAVVVGHIWPLQIGFKGGKGIAPALGGLVAYDPTLAFLLLGLFLGACLLTRAREAAGMMAFLFLPVVAALIECPNIKVVACVVLTTLLVWAHRRNLVVIMERWSSRWA